MSAGGIPPAFAGGQVAIFVNLYDLGIIVNFFK
jgi:hypothetical protein